MAQRHPFPDSPFAWIPAPMLAAEFRVTLRCLYNWMDDPALDFPRPRTIHKIFILSATKLKPGKPLARPRRRPGRPRWKRPSSRSLNAKPPRVTTPEAAEHYDDDGKTPLTRRDIAGRSTRNVFAT